MTATNVVLTPEILGFLKKGFTYEKYLQVHPFSWNELEGCPELVTGKWRQLIWKIHASVGISYWLFLLVRFIQICLYEDSNTSQKIYMLFVLILYSFIPMHYSNLILKQEEFSACIGTFIKFMDAFERRFVEPGAKSPKLINLSGMGMKLLYLALNGDAVIMVVMSILLPTSAEFLSSVFLTDDALGEALWSEFLMKLSVIMVSSLFQAWMVYIFFSVGLLATFGALAVMCPLIVLVAELSSKTCSVTRAELRDHSNKLNMWRAVQLILQDFNHVMMIPLVGAKLLMIFLAIFSAYGAIKFSGIFAVGLAFIGLSSTSLLVIIMTILSGFYEKSREQRFEWSSGRCLEGGRDMSSKKGFRTGTNDRVRQLIEKKQVQSLHCISMSIFGMYRIDKVMVLRMCEFMLESTINFILLYR